MPLSGCNRIDTWIKGLNRTYSIIELILRVMAMGLDRAKLNVVSMELESHNNGLIGSKTWLFRLKGNVLKSVDEIQLL